MVIRLAEELDAAGGGKALEGCEHVLRRGCELLQDDAGKRECHFELRMPLQEAQEERVHGEVAFVCDLPEHLAVGLLVKVRRIGSDVKDAVAAQAVGLMHLEVKADAYHGSISL